jgi:RNA polymerase sigma-70 factor (ECF subfamily)
MGQSEWTSSSVDERFERLYERYYPCVLAYALRRTPAGTAEDVVANTFLVAWRRLGSVPEEPLPWLLGVARKTLSNQRRASRRYLALVDRLRTEEVAGTRTPRGIEFGELESVARAVTRLPQRDQELLMLVAWDGLSTKEAAVVVGISHAACRVRIHRARRRLETAFAREQERHTNVDQGRFQTREDTPS